MPTRDHGVGAVVSALIQFIHPSQHFRSKFPNPVSSQWLSGCIMLRQKVKKGVKKEPAGHSGPAQGLQDGRWHFH